MQGWINLWKQTGNECTWTLASDSSGKPGVRIERSIQEARDLEVNGQMVHVSQVKMSAKITAW